MREVLLFLSGLAFMFWLAVSTVYLFRNPLNNPLNLILGILVSGSILCIVGARK